MAAALGVVALTAMWVVASSPVTVAFLVAWDTTALVMVVWVLPLILRSDSDATARLATREDDSRAGADAVLVVAGLASLMGVGLALLDGARLQGTARAWITTLAVASIMLAWASVQTVFTLRYAHLYYYDGARGIDFPGTDTPDYLDFDYLAVTVGTTYQVSDTDITTRAIRRTVTRQALLSYVFGTFVVAVTINVVAGLVR